MATATIELSNGCLIVLVDRRSSLDTYSIPLGSSLQSKPVGSGQGLGLATAHQIVEMHKGSIDVQSERGKGTEFVLNLPIQLSADI